MPFDLNVMVGGEAGQGIQTIGFVLGKALVRGGWHVFADQDYESRIRGGHNFYRVRASDRAVKAQSEKLDILAAMDRRTLNIHREALKDHGLVVMDQQSLGFESPGTPILDVPLEKLALEAAGDKITANSVAAGAIMGLLGGDLAVIEEVLNKQFAQLRSTASIETGCRVPVFKWQRGFVFGGDCRRM
jgi:2-oxoglutarate ferredoxin oxidoreductase subunit alpha